MLSAISSLSPKTFSVRILSNAFIIFFVWHSIVFVVSFCLISFWVFAPLLFFVVVLANRFSLVCSACMYVPPVLLHHSIPPMLVRPTAQYVVFVCALLVYCTPMVLVCQLALVVAFSNMLYFSVVHHARRGFASLVVLQQLRLNHYTGGYCMFYASGVLCARK